MSEQQHISQPQCVHLTPIPTSINRSHLRV